MKTGNSTPNRAAAWLILTLGLMPNVVCLATTIPEQSMGQVTPLGDYGYGASVGVSGEYAIVGNHLECQDTGKDFRSVDILVRNTVDGRWDKWKSLAPVSGRFRYFGWSVAIDGDTAVVGAPDFLNVDVGGADSGSGAFFIYGRNQGGANQWGFVTSFSATGASFGYHVRLSGDTLVVGEPRHNGEGRIYIHSRNQGGANIWGRVKTLSPVGPPVGPIKASSAHPFGTVFDVSLGRLAVGGYDEWDDTTYTVNIYQSSLGGAGNWGLERTIHPGSAAENQFGHRVALEGNRLAVSFMSAQGRQIRLYSGASYDTLTTLSWPGMADFGPADIGGDILAIRMRLSSGPAVANIYRWPDAGGFSVLGTRFVGYGATERSEGIAATSDSVLLGVDDPVSQASASGAGCVRALDRTTGGADNWGLWAAVKPEMPGGGGFGKSMVMKGDWLVVGNPDFPAGGTARGLVSVFVRGGDRWILVSRLSPMSGPGWPAPGPQDNARFGESVAVDSAGNVLVGAPGENGNDGAAYRFERVVGSSSNQQEGVSYVQTERLSSGVTGTGMKLGSSVAMDAWMMFAGAPEGGAGGAGSVYEWRLSAGGWVRYPLPRTDADGNTANDAFGTALAMDGLNLVVTAMGDENNGSAYYYEYDTPTHTWVQRQEIIPTDTTTGLFGKSVALKDSRLVVGVYPFALFAIGPGNAFLFNRSGSTWTQKAFMRTPGLENGDAHGFSAALGKDFAVVGVPGDDGVGNGAMNAGGAWLSNTYGGATNSEFLHEIRSGVAGEESGASVAADWFYLAVSAPKSDAVGMDSGLVRLYRLGSYERWACSKLLNPGTNGPWHDEDGDGATNLEEFAFTSDPKSGGSRGQLFFDLVTITPGAPKHLRAIYARGGSHSTEGLQVQFQSGNSPANMGYGGMTVTFNDGLVMIGYLTRNVEQDRKAFVRLRLDYPVRE